MLYSVFPSVVYFIPTINSVCQSQSLSSSHATPFPLGIHTFVLYVCVSVSALQIWSSIPFSRFHMYGLIYDICFSLSDWLHSIWQSRSFHVSTNDPLLFLFMANIPLYICTTSFLSIPLLMDTKIYSKFNRFVVNMNFPVIVVCYTYQFVLKIMQVGHSMLRLI